MEGLKENEEEVVVGFGVVDAGQVKGNCPIGENRMPENVVSGEEKVVEREG